MAPKKRIARHDLAQIHTGGLKALHAKLGLPWTSAVGHTVEMRRDAVWKKLGGDGEETVLVDAAWWAAARVMGSKETLARFDELVAEAQGRQARTATPAQGDRPTKKGSTGTPATPGSSGETAGTSADAAADRSEALQKTLFSMDEEMATQVEGSAQICDDTSTGDAQAGWQTVGKGRRASKRTKQTAIESPIVEQTPPRRERGERSGAREEDSGDTAKTRQD